jgi:hypothetical protein
LTEYEIRLRDLFSDDCCGWSYKEDAQKSLHNGSPRVNGSPQVFLKKGGYFVAVVFDAAAGGLISVAGVL